MGKQKITWKLFHFFLYLFQISLQFILAITRKLLKPKSVFVIKFYTGFFFLKNSTDFELRCFENKVCKSDIIAKLLHFQITELWYFLRFFYSTTMGNELSFLLLAASNICIKHFFNRMGNIIVATVITHKIYLSNNVVL